MTWIWYVLEISSMDFPVEGSLKCHRLTYLMNLLSQRHFQAVDEDGFVKSVYRQYTKRK